MLVPFECECSSIDSRDIKEGWRRGAAALPAIFCVNPARHKKGGIGGLRLCLRTPMPTQKRETSKGKGGMGGLAALPANPHVDPIP